MTSASGMRAVWNVLLFVLSFAAVPGAGALDIQPPQGKTWDGLSGSYWNSDAFTNAQRALCARDKPGNQSPIHLKTPAFVDPRLRALTFSYDDSTTRKLENNGHSVEMKF